MALTRVTQLVEALFIAIMLIFLTSPQLLPIMQAGNHTMSWFHLF